MKITTLTYIHELLKQEVKKQDQAFKKIQNMVKDAEEYEKDNIQSLKKIEENTFKKRMEALNTLLEFETQEW